MLDEEEFMATRQDIIGIPAAANAIGGIRFDWAMIAASGWLIGGGYLDGWAHAHGKVDNTFFTPWHAVLYTGYLAAALIMIGTMIINQRRGKSWGRALPTGYELSLLGVAIFGMAGAGDLVWHTLFGIEKGVEPLFSPTHLMLLLGGALIVTGPLRAAWSRRRAPQNGLAGYLPMLLSVTLLLSGLTFILQFAHPFVYTWPLTGRRPYDNVNLLITDSSMSIMLQSGVLLSVLLIVLRRWTLPFGSLALILTLNIALLSTQQDTYKLIPAAFAAGLVGDLLLQRLKPSVAQPRGFRIFGFVLPIVFFGLYFLTLALTEGMWWSVHVWTGTLVMAGAVGFALSYLAVPPQIQPTED
jgi:hypothetical protein